MGDSDSNRNSALSAVAEVWCGHCHQPFGVVIYVMPWHKKKYSVFIWKQVRALIFDQKKFRLISAFLLYKFGDSIADIVEKGKIVQK